MLMLILLNMYSLELFVQSTRAVRELSSPKDRGGLAGRDDDDVRFKEVLAGFEFLLPRSVSSTNVVGIPSRYHSLSPAFHHKYQRTLNLSIQSAVRTTLGKFRS